MGDVPIKPPFFGYFIAMFEKARGFLVNPAPLFFQGQSSGEHPPIFCAVNLLVLNVGNGWVAGGCWDDYYL
jgi:hypothetical protein